MISFYILFTKFYKLGHHNILVSIFLAAEILHVNFIFLDQFRVTERITKRLNRHIYERQSEEFVTTLSMFYYVCPNQLSVPDDLFPKKQTKNKKN